MRERELLSADELATPLTFLSLACREIESGIQKAHEDIAQAKKELVEARKVRRNKMEYDAMAKV